VKKLTFRFGLKKHNPAELAEEDGKKKEGEEEEEDLGPPPIFDPCYFPPESSCVSVFTPQRKCFGKHKAYSQKLLTKGRPFGDKPPFDKEFILGKYAMGGAVTFVLDMMVTDDECATVQV
jgi:hypothetical protein